MTAGTCNTLRVKLAVAGLLVLIVGAFAGWTPAISLAQDEVTGYGSEPVAGSAVVINTAAGVSGSGTVTLSAVGDADLTITGYALTTSAEITVSGAEVPFTLAAGGDATETLTVVCDSAVPGVFTDQLTVEYDAVDSPAAYTVACNVLPANFAQNGDFSADTAEWSGWGDTVLVTNPETGVLELTNTGPGGVYQDSPYVIPAGAPFEMTVDLGNSSAISQAVEIHLHAPDWVDALSCRFTVPEGAPLATYTMRGVTAIPWTDLRLEVMPQTFEGQPALLVDNVTVQYQPGLVVDGTACVAALVADANLVQNSDFATDFAGWGVLDDLEPIVEASVLELAGSGSIFQDVSVMVPAATPLEMTLDLGNTSDASQAVKVSLTAPDAADEFVCEFSVPGGSALQTYTLRGLTALEWDDLHVEIGAEGDQPALQIDNVNVQYKPALAVAEVECVPPRIAANTNVIRNGDFVADSADWATEGNVVSAVNAQVLELTNTGPGGVFQNVGVSVPGSAPLELTIGLGNSGTAPKDVEVLLNAPGWSDALVCAFTLAAEAPLQTYTLRGLTPSSANDLRVEIMPVTYDDQPALQIDNVDVQYKPMLRIFGVECVPPVLVANTNLMRNGDFASDTSEWFIWGEVEAVVDAGVLELTSTEAGGIYQDLGVNVPEGMAFELTVELGNRADASKDVEVFLHAPDEWDEVVWCPVSIPANSELQTYTVRGITTLPWADVRAEIVPKSYDSLPALRVDNASLQYRPGDDIAGIECVLPAE